jgi:riboflavin synthase
MFTGIVEGLGRVVSIGSGVLAVTPPPDMATEPFREGESVAVNGCCLTVISKPDEPLRFDLSPETLHRTALEDLSSGSVVNLERAMRVDGRFGGHVVQGHVDTTGQIVSITPIENAELYRFSAPPEYDRYLIDKGSITVDGISLTVVEPNDGVFDVWVIPHTLVVTNLGTLAAGARVNLEFDALAKYVEKMLVALKR